MNHVAVTILVILCFLPLVLFANEKPPLATPATTSPPAVLSQSDSDEEDEENEDEDEKPIAAIAPVTSLGEISEVEKQIIFNSLLTKLSQTHNLISQDQFKAAQEMAFEELEAEECTEEQCIRKIQDLLQVENLFVLQVLKHNQDTQLSLTLVDLDKKKVESDYCQKCDIPTLNSRIDQLVDKLIRVKPKSVPPLPSVEQESAPQVSSKAERGKHHLRFYVPIANMGTFKRITQLTLAEDSNVKAENKPKYEKKLEGTGDRLKSSGSSLGVAYIHPWGIGIGLSQIQAESNILIDQGGNGSVYDYASLEVNLFDFSYTLIFLEKLSLSLAFGIPLSSTATSHNDHNYGFEDSSSSTVEGSTFCLGAGYQFSVWEIVLGVRSTTLIYTGFSQTSSSGNTLLGSSTLETSKLEAHLTEIWMGLGWLF
ncbi:hypothetical protein WDW89_14130 [Deltaproteobacteria bacterium TL4]